MLQSTTNSLVSDVSGLITSIPLDITIIFSIIVLFIFHGFYSGKNKALTTFISLYITGFVLLMFPYWSVILKEGGGSNLLSFKLFIFAILFILVRISLKWIIFGEFPKRFTAKLMQIMSLSIFSTLLILFYAHQVISIGEMYTFSPAIEGFFSNVEYFFWLLIFEIFGLYLLTRYEF